VAGFNRALTALLPPRPHAVFPNQAAYLLASAIPA